MSRNKTLAAINIIGFSIGIAAGLMIYLWVDDELHFDAFHLNANHIYRVVQLEKSGNIIIKNANNSPGLGEEMQKKFPQIIDHTYFRQNFGYTYFLSKGNFINAIPATVDKNFFTFFNFPFVEGKAETAFIDEKTIVISEKFARKLFGKEPALGKEATLSNMFNEQNYYRIGGVVKLPHNTHLSFDVALQKDIQSYATSGMIYLRFDERAKMNEQTKEALSLFLSDYERSNNLLTFQPLKDIHLESGFIHNTDQNPGNPQYVVVFSILAVIIVLMGAFNFMTLSTAQATKRFREMAVRKVYGSQKSELMWQFYSETLIQVFIALLLALALSQIALPYLNSFTNKEMTFHFGFQFWITVTLLLLISGLVAGSYPGMYLSSFSPMMIFKGGNISGKKAGFIYTMVIIQFVLSISLIICTLVVYQQLSYIKTKDLGIDRENIITTRSNLWYEVEGFKKEVMRNPNVLSVSMSFSTPEAFYAHRQNVTWEGKSAQDTVQMVVTYVDSDFAKTYGLKFVAGESLRHSWEDYLAGKGGEAMINESAARLMGMDNPVGKTVNDKKIAGVVRDFHFRSLKEPIIPLIMIYSHEAVGEISFKLSPYDRQATIAFIKETYEQMRPGTGFEYRYFDKLLADSYLTENKLGLLFMIFTSLSLLISCLGILGLTALSVVQRTKEIGLRKIAGASVSSIMLLLNKNYILRIVIAFVIAIPVSALLMNRWLEGFAYYAPLSWWIFALAGFITFFVAASTISWLCYRAAEKNPVESLKIDN